MAAAREELRATEVRLLSAALDRIRRYRGRRNGLPQLAIDIDAVASGLEEIDSDLSDPMRRKWWVIEEANAFALDEGLLHPLETDAELVVAAIEKIEELVKDKLRDF